MKRDKKFWSRLNKEERSEFVRLERAGNQYGSMGGYLPDDCSECTNCGNPTTGFGLCNDCLDRIIYLTDKVEGRRTG